MGVEGTGDLEGVVGTGDLLCTMEEAGGHARESPVVAAMTHLVSPDMCGHSRLKLWMLPGCGLCGCGLQRQKTSAYRLVPGRD